MPLERGKEVDPWQHRFNNHLADAELLSSEGAHRDAFQAFKRALSEVPAPVGDHEEATKAVMGMADCYYFLGQYENAVKPLNDLLTLPGGAANAYVRLRRGQVFAHLGDLDGARTEWAMAYINYGGAVFEGEEDCREEIARLINELEQDLPK